MLRKHPDVVEKGKTVDMSDLLQDPVVVFQRKYVVPKFYVYYIYVVYPLECIALKTKRNYIFSQIQDL